MKLVLFIIIYFLTSCSEKHNAAIIEDYGDRFYGKTRASYLDSDASYGGIYPKSVIARIGENIDLIAEKNKVDKLELRKINNLGQKDFLDNDILLTLPNHIIHIVLKYQTLGAIAEFYSINAEDIMSSNNIHEVYYGQRLVIPIKRHSAGIIENNNMHNMIEDANNFGSAIKLEDEIPTELESKEDANEEKLTNSLFSSPIDGKITKPYVAKSKKNLKDPAAGGILLSAPANAKIKAVGDGEVVFASGSIDNYGNLTIIRHKDTLYSIYGHQQKINVKKGDQVKKGQIIGLIGTNKIGGKDGNLFFSIRKGAETIDPTNYIKF